VHKQSVFLQIDFCTRLFIRLLWVQTCPRTCIIV